MNISLNWIKEYVDLSKVDVKDLANKLSIAGTEIEEISYLGSGTNLVIGQIIECLNHPNSDHLHVCKVNTGKEILQIVCGARNARKDLKVIVALVGAKLPKINITKSVIRGVESNGMLCSLLELGVEDKYLSDYQKAGIEELDNNAPLGDDPLDYLLLNDTILHFKPLPNRGDLLSVYSFAKEIGAVLNLKVKPLEVLEIGDFVSKYTTGSTTNKCSVFLGREVRNITIQESPLIIKRLLQASGVRPINNIVDIGNYVMLLTGQPLHMYDLDKVKGKDFNVELSSALVKGLDEKDYQLKDDLGIVINGQFGCIAGVFGGLDTSISQDTKNIFIESAIFDNNSIRKTSLKLDLQSDSSQRFIRGIDKNRTYLASKLAVSLIKPYLTLEKGISKEIIYDVLKELPVTVSLTLGQTNKLLGTDYKVNDIQEVFDRLDFKYTLEKETFLVNVPSHRKDITIYQDLIEEIIRLKGFNTLKEVNIQSETHGLLSFRQQQLDLIRNTLTAQGLFENISYILLKEDNANDFNIFSQAQSLKILNPLNLERHELRRSIIPSLLINRDYNLKRQVSQTEIFEIGNIFSSESGQLHLGILIDELYNQTNWLNNKKADFYTMKGLVLNVLTLLGVNLNRVKITPYDLQDSFYHPGKSALISFDKKVIGVIGYLHTLALKKYDLSKEVIVSEIVLDDLLNAKTNQIVFIEPSIYPTINRDIAFLIRDEIKAADIIQTIKRIGKSMIKEIEVFDVYKGNNIPEGLKSLALSLVFCSNERTLTSEEINILMSNIIKELENKYQIILRK